MMRNCHLVRRRSLLVLAALGIAVALPGGRVAAQDSALPVAALPTAPSWSDRDMAALIDAVEGAAREGLDPDDYRLAELRAHADMADGERDRLADAAALSLARDYLIGHVTDRDGQDWHIARSPYEVAALPGQLQRARADWRLDAFLQGLLPRDPRYATLRDALATETDDARRAKIRANMERWRWLPRDLGPNHLYVNVPSYRLDVVEQGATLASYTVIVGAKDTPTPILAGPAGSLVVNPTWNVPQSIIRKGLRGRGFIWSRNPDGSLAARQAPGPGNALGKIKINLVNDQAIYLHDTNAPSAFARKQRALSHGCIRVQHIDELASQLLSDGPDEAAQFDEAMADTRTRTVGLPRQWQVWLVYFTLDQGEDGQLKSYGDPYDRDAALIAQLGGGTPAMQVATR